MNAMSVREFNANTSKALSRVRAGETITLTNRGEAFAKIQPLQPRLERGTPEWQAAYDRAIQGMRDGLPLGGRANYEERTA